VRKRRGQYAHGEYVYTTTGKRGFVDYPTSTASYSVLFFGSDSGIFYRESWSANLLSPSGNEPSDAECVAWAKRVLK
jgi:hypothetical protein